MDIILDKNIMARLRTIEGWNQLTFIISSHRLTTVRLSDQVIFISPSEGIVSDGDSDKVLKEENVIKFFKEQMVDLSLD